MGTENPEPGAITELLVHRRRVLDVGEKGRHGAVACGQAAQVRMLDLGPPSELLHGGAKGASDAMLADPSRGLQRRLDRRRPAREPPPALAPPPGGGQAFSPGSPPCRRLSLDSSRQPIEQPDHTYARSAASGSAHSLPAARSAAPNWTPREPLGLGAGRLASARPGARAPACCRAPAFPIVAARPLGYAASRQAAKAPLLSRRCKARDSSWRTRSCEIPSSRPVSRSDTSSSPPVPKRS
jgi:hypothetical protein